MDASKRQDKQANDQWIFWTIFGAAILAIPIAILGPVAMGLEFLYQWVSASFAFIYFYDDQKARKLEVAEYEGRVA